MNGLTPPTDNLYKFVAVGALALAAFFFYTNMSNNAIFVQNVATSAAHGHDRLVDIEAVPPISMPPVRVIFEADDAIKKAAKDRAFGERADDPASQRLARQIVMLERLMQPPSETEMKEYLARDDVKAYFIAANNLTPAKYQAFANSMTLADFRERIRPDLEIIQRLHLIASMQMFAKEDMLRRQKLFMLNDKIGFWGGVISIAVAVVAFGFWYGKFQRHQDAILRAERRRAEAKNLTS